MDILRGFNLYSIIINEWCCAVFDFDVLSCVKQKIDQTQNVIHCNLKMEIGRSVRKEKKSD